MDNPTQADYEAYQAVVMQLPVPDFGDWAKIEKERDTPRWQEALKEARQKMGISDQEWERILRETT